MEVYVYSDRSELPGSLADDYGEGYFADGRSLLVITWNNGSVDVHHDFGEPEDNSFVRDYSWIETALDRAYEEGRKVE